MSGLLQQLAAWAAEAEPASGPALATLTDSAATADALADPAAVVRYARLRFDAQSERLQRLVARLSDDQTASLHRASVDQRAVVAAGVWSYVRQAVVCLPDELAELFEAGCIDEDWQAREALRLGACLALLQPLLASLERDAISAHQFATRVHAEAAGIVAVAFGGAGGAGGSS